MIGYPASEHFGRKRVFLICNLLYILGYTLILFSESFLTLIAGRSVTCLAAGLGVMLPFMMISEITTIQQRAPLSVSASVFASAGSLIAYLAAFFLSPRYVVFLLIGESAMFLLLSPFLCESPHFLIKKGRLEEAERVYRRLRGKSYTGIHQEIAEVPWTLYIALAT